MSGGSTGESGGGRLGGGRFVFGVALSVAFGTVCGSVGGGGGHLVSGVAYSVAFGAVCGVFLYFWVMSVEMARESEKNVI